MNTILVITHDDIFHADEVCSVALIKLAHPNCEVKVVRTRDVGVLASAQKDPNVFVVDVGYIYDPAMNNYDHHQDGSLAASNWLVWRDVCANFWSAEVNKEMQRFFASISDWDNNVGKVIQSQKGLRQLSLSQVVSGFNRSPMNPQLQDRQFALAVEFMITAIQNEVYAAEQRIAARQAWKDRQTLPNGIAVCDQFIPFWETAAAADCLGIGSFIVVMPNPKGWQLVSRDSTVCPLPSTEQWIAAGFTPVFAHVNRFITVFATKEQAVAAAKSLS